MNSPNYDHLVTRFLQGQLSDPELGEFLKRLETDFELKSTLSKELSVDSCIMEQTICNPQIEDLKNEQNWAALVTSESMVNEKDQNSYTDMEWGSLIRNSFKIVNSNRKGKFIHFRIRYLVAACLLLAMSIGTIIVYTKSNNKSPTQVSVVSTDTAKPNVYPIVLADTASVITTEKEPGVLRFNGNSALLVQKESKILFKEKKDTVVYLELTDGTVIFNVEKGKYHRFIVSTPIINVTVTGTVFKVTSEDGYVLVSVLDGSVTINHRKKTLQTEIKRGEAIIADKDSLLEMSFDSLAQFPERELLSDFLKHSNHGSKLYKSNTDTLPDNNGIGMSKGNTRTDSNQKVPGNEFNGIFLPQRNNLRAWDVLDVEMKESDNGLNEKLKKVSTFISQGDTMQAIALLYNGLKNETKVLSRKKLYRELLAIYYAQGSVDSTESIMNQMYQGDKFYTEDEQIVLRHAEFLKNHKNYGLAHFWYSLFVDRFPRSTFRPDAYYQMWWCLISEKTSKNRTSDFLSHQSPEFFDLEKK